MAHHERLSLGAVILSTIGLVILGGFQVHWSRQASEAAREQIGVTLKAAMLGWHSDLLRELSAPALAVSTAIDEHEPIANYLEEYDEWIQTARHPDLVAAIFVLQRAGRRVFKLVRLNPATGMAEPADWPANMECLREMLTSPSHLRSRLAGCSAAPGVRLADAPNEWRFDPHIPALVYADTYGDSDIVDRRAPSNCVIIEFNSQVIEKKILPELAQRYFGNSRGLEYQVAVIGDIGERHPVHVSATDFNTKDGGAADARMNIFGPHRSASAPADKPESSAIARPEATISSMQKGSWRNFAAAHWFEVIRYAPTEPDWYLMVKPIGGSLDNVLLKARRRDLIVSFAVLSLLVISTLMVLITGLRAQHLGRMQLQFISAVSHELRTPLAVMCSAADNLADGIINGKQQLSQYRTIIAEQARQLTNLMEQVLNFAATGEHKPQHRLHLLGVSEIITTALGRTAGLLQEAKFQVEQKIESGLPQVMGDVDALSQCLQNLIVNAVKYSGASRWIGVYAGISESAGKKEIQIRIADHGIGIGSSDLNRIFQPFYRSPSVISAVPGTGLGLALAANIAQELNGRLSVSSTPGVGSVFSLHLPVANKILHPDKSDCDSVSLSCS